MPTEKKDQQPGNKIDTDNDGKYRTKGDTSDHGDPRSPYGNQNQKKNTDESEEVEE